MRQRGFSWIELLAVVTVVAILALMAVPGLQDQALKGQVKEGLGLADLAKQGVQAAYSLAGDMPANNEAAGIPPRNKIVSSLVTEVAVDKGAITLTFGNNASRALEGKHVTIRPAIVADQPRVPISWICAKVGIPKGMEIRGDDKTDIQASWLPIDCRGMPDKK
jgi:type IV pilus assembly protein PilA